MTADTLRQALRELNGERDLVVVFAHVHPGEGVSAAHSAPVVRIKRAMLVPDEPDHLVKVTDGQSIYILDAERVAYLRIGKE